MLSTYLAVLGAGVGSGGRGGGGGGVGVGLGGGGGDPPVAVPPAAYGCSFVSSSRHADRNKQNGGAERRQLAIIYCEAPETRSEGPRLDSALDSASRVETRIHRPPVPPTSSSFPLLPLPPPPRFRGSVAPSSPVFRPSGPPVSRPPAWLAASGERTAGQIDRQTDSAGRVSERAW